MSDNTKIEWADATVNAVNGCSVVSPGCTNCYAMRLAGTRMKHHPTREGLTVDTKAGPVWNGEVRLHEAALLQPLRWKRPRQIFWNAHGDLFHKSVRDAWIDRVFAVCAMTPQHTHMILTKRSAWMREYMTDGNRWFAIWTAMCRLAEQGYPEFQGIAKPVLPLPNVWLGVSVEDQQRANERIPDLLQTPASVRFLSCEPLLGPIDLDRVRYYKVDPNPAPGPSSRPFSLRALTGQTGFYAAGRWHRIFDTFPRIDWVIAGGESGPGARPMHPDWARSLRDQCAAAGVPFHFKQWGEFAPGEIAGEYLDPEKAAKGLSLFDGRWDECWSEVDGHVDDEPDVYRIGKKRAGRLLDGVEHNGMPTANASLSMTGFRSERPDHAR